MDRVDEFFGVEWAFEDFGLGVEVHCGCLELDYLGGIDTRRRGLII